MSEQTRTEPSAWHDVQVEPDLGGLQSANEKQWVVWQVWGPAAEEEEVREAAVEVVGVLMLARVWVYTRKARWLPVGYR